MMSSPAPHRDGRPIKVPSHMPRDAAAIATYSEALEVLRSQKFRPEQPTDNAPVSAGVLTFSHGAAHTGRRRIMNRLVRTPALDHYREVLIIPALRRQFRELIAQPAPDGVYRTDLVRFTMLPFVRFAAALAGFDMSRAGSDEELLGLIMDMSALNRVRWSTEDHRPYIERAVAAKARFKQGYVEPALAACPYRPGDEVPAGQHDLVSLVAAELDPGWRDDPDLKVRDLAISLFAAGVGSSAEMMTNLLDELTEWLPVHPEAQAGLDDVEFVSSLVQESLRLHPTPPATGRIALEDVHLASGRVIRAGQWAAILLSIANRDRSVYGDDADTFDPRRQVPAGATRYGLSFGAGSHQCLGLPVVLGSSGVGSHVHVARLMILAGVSRDLDRPPAREPSERTRWETYPVIFTSPERVLTGPAPIP